MLKIIFYNFIWFTSLASITFAASRTLKTLFEGTIADLISPLLLLAISVLFFVHTNHLIEKE